MELTFKSKEQKKKNICPIKNIAYIGACVNSNCCANLARITAGKQSGCFHSKYKTTMVDFAALFNLNETEMKAKYSKSISIIEKSVEFYTCLQQLREKCNFKFFCINCGAPLLGNFSSCMNTEKCSIREKYVNKQINRSPMNLPGLNITKKDIWLLIFKYSKDEIRKNFGVYMSKHFWLYKPPALEKS